MATQIFTDITDQIRELQAQLEEHAEAHDGDISDFPLLAHLEDLEKAQADRAGLEHMLCNLACMALEYEGEAEAMEAQAARIAQAAAGVKKKGAGIRSFIAGRLGPEDKIKDDRVKLSMRKSEVVDLAEGVKAEDLPLEFQRTTLKVEAEKALLKSALKAGQVIDGVSITTRYNLQIK